MVARRLGILSLYALCSLFALHARADTLIGSGSFTSDDDSFTYAFSPTTIQNYTFKTTSFASGGFVPVLTLFNASGGVPLAFAETDNSDVSLSRNLGPGSYLLYLTEDPNVFTSTLAAGTLFAGFDTITGDTCGVSGGTFLDVFNGCNQLTGDYAVTLDTGAAVTPEPATWMLVLTPIAFMVLSRRRYLVS